MTPAQAREEAITTPTVCARIVQLARRQARRLLDRLETRRAQAQRRQPATVTGRLRHARTLLILCQGNVSRSVFAAHLLASRIQGERTPVIMSAGLGTQPGWRAHRRVVERCKALSIDIRSHASVAVTAGMMRAADVVFVMEVAHLVAVTRRFPTARRKTFLLTCLAPHLPMDIADPAGKPDETVDGCLDQVTRALEPIVDVLAAREAATWANASR
jgi:protein-tyrosine-phosphatase